MYNLCGRSIPFYNIGINETTVISIVEYLRKHIITLLKEVCHLIGINLASLEI
ncbi:hypothetical protein ACJDT4_22270 [Clostridium neuense]|uniref:Transposase n=1 Tax=Clostridium neuense TaxID=1728934 RepID=A0ABW8TKZ7_9CLOT